MDLKVLFLLLSKVIHKIGENFKMIPEKKKGRLKVMSIMQTQTQENSNNNSLPSIPLSSPCKKQAR